MKHADLKENADAQSQSMEYLKCFQFDASLVKFCGHIISATLVKDFSLI